MKKILILAMVSMLTVSCTTTQKEKFVEKTSETVRKGAVKYLGCETGEEVKSDLKRELGKVLKLSSSAGAKEDVWGTVCEQAVRLALPFLIGFGEEKLPKSWRDDGCNLDELEGDLNNLASGLCGML